jgi:predicted nucleic acid-binding protein
VKVPDANIAATALVGGCRLITRNVDVGTEIETMPLKTPNPITRFILQMKPAMGMA